MWSLGFMLNHYPRPADSYLLTMEAMGLNTECHVSLSGVPNMQSNSGYDREGCQCIADSPVELSRSPHPDLGVPLLPCLRTFAPVLEMLGTLGEERERVGVTMTKPFLRHRRSRVFS